MRVLHLPTVVGGMAWELAQGERRLGLDSKVLVSTHPRFDYPYDVCLGWERKGPLGVFLSSLRAFMKYRSQFDVFHFNYGSTLIDFRSRGIHHWDLPFYPKAKMVFTYNGCDARQKYRTIERVSASACHEDGCNGGICKNGRADKDREKRIRIVSKHAHHIFAVNPDLLHFLPTPITSFLPYCIAGWDQIPSPPYQIPRKIKILHSPTDRIGKGSHYILPALERLSRKYPIEVILVENKPHQEALRIYEQATLVVDQVLTGWYGSVAVEAMKMGKPVAVFIRKEDLGFVPKGMARDLQEAFIHIDRSNIEVVLEGYLKSSELLLSKSEAGRAYVHRWHDPDYVAGITKAVYEV